MPDCTSANGDTARARGDEVRRTSPGAGLAKWERETGVAPPGSRELRRRNFQYSREAVAASQRLRKRFADQGRRAEALRERIAAAFADVAAVEEKIARIHETLASEGSGNVAVHRRLAADARKAVRRAGEIGAQVAGDQRASERAETISRG